MVAIRSPICSVLGHVDHGKTSVLDRIRQSVVAKGEAGGITQAIGASIIPLDTIKKVCGTLLQKIKMEFTIPGLLFIDTPGHAAFTSLRKRGGSIADIAILVVDLNEGFMPQTIESIDILRGYKTPFVIIANKVDLVKGWRANGTISLLQNIQVQEPDTIGDFETKLYTLVAELDKLGLQSERFDRIEDYTKQIAIVPASAKTGEGIPELLMVLIGLAQKYLEQKLHLSETAKGTILEVKEEKGLGKTMDVILYDGSIKVNDTIVIGGMQNAIVGKIKALFEPTPLQEMRERKTKFISVKEAVAATGVKISATGVDDVVAGMPLLTATKELLEKAKEEVQAEVESVLIQTDKDGIVIKADTLGSLEALTTLLREKNISIKKASIGFISKKDLADAESNLEKNPLESVILGFNVEISPEAKDFALHSRSKVLTNNIIYRLIEDFESWQDAEKKKAEKEKLSETVRPCKILVLRGFIFRQNNPAIVGCEIIGGMAKTGISIMKDGREIGYIKAMEKEKKNVTTASRGEQLAISFENVIIGRQMHEGDTVYSIITEEDFRKFKELKDYLAPDDVQVLKEIAEQMRKQNPVWGV